MPELARLEIDQEQAIANNSQERIGEILNQLRSLKTSLVSHLLNMGDLLLEVKQNNYHIISGYSDFESWLDDSQLDMKISQAYYLMRVITKTKAVGIERPQLELCDFSALKEIVVLNPDTQADEIRELVDYAASHGVKEVKQRVDNIRVADGQDIYVLKGYRVSQEVWDGVISPALEQIRMIYGQTINSETGEIEEISEGRAYELLAAEYLSGADRGDNGLL